MKQKLLIILFCCLLLNGLFASVELIYPVDSEEIDGYPIRFEWQYEGPIREKVYSSYSLYIGSEKDNMHLISNNLNENYCNIFQLPKQRGKEVYWKIRKNYIDGEKVESATEKFSFTPNPEKTSNTERQTSDPGEIKIVVTWQDSTLDLDSHLSGILPNGEYFRMFRPLAEFKRGSSWPDYVTLDYIDTEGKDETEVTTIKKPVLDSIYKFSVRDYTNKAFEKPDSMSQSNVVVTVYQDDLLINQFSIPVNKFGSYWNVFEMFVSPYGEIEFSTINSFTDYYSGIDALKTPIIEKDDETTTSKPTSTQTQTPATEKSSIGDVEVSFVLIDESEKNRLLDKLEIYKDYSEVLHALKIFLPDGEELKPETVNVEVNGKAAKSFVKESRQLKSELDIMFVVDVTGSMREEIKGIKNSIKQFTRDLNEHGFEPRIGFVPYDDYAPSAYYGWLDFNNDQETYDFLDGFRKMVGGNEIPYSAIFYAVNNSDWARDSERHIILVTDEFSEGEAKFEIISKEKLIKRLSSDYFVHSILSTDENYNEADTSYDELGDPRELSEQTQGVIEYTDSEGNIDLTASGILSFMDNSYYVFFETENGFLEEVNISFETTEKKGKISF